MSLLVGKDSSPAIDEFQFDDHVAQIGQNVLYVAVLECPCAVNALTDEPDLNCQLCGGTGVYETPYDELETFDYESLQIKDGEFGEKLDHHIGVELLTPANCSIEGPYQVTAEALTPQGGGRFTDTLSNPIEPFSFAATSDSGKLAVDNGEGGIAGQVLAGGTINYATGDTDFTYEDEAASTTATANYIYTRTFVLNTDFTLIEDAANDLGPININWTGEEPITNREYRILYTLIRDCVAQITNNVFKDKLTQFEAGLWRDGDARITPAATEFDRTQEPWVRVKSPIYNLSVNDRVVLWNSRRPQIDKKDVPSGDVVDLKYRFLTSVIRVHRINDAGTAIQDITPDSIDRVEGKITLPAGHEGKVVMIKYLHRPVYHVYYESPHVRAHEQGKALPKFVHIRPVDSLDRGSKMKLTA